MLFDPVRHETLQDIPWDEARVRAAIAHIVDDTESRYTPDGWWPLHPRDVEPEDDPRLPATPLYHGACGVFWALHHLQDVGAVKLARSYHDQLDKLLQRNAAWLAVQTEGDEASYLTGELPIRLWEFGHEPSGARADRLAELISANIDHPARKLMWGAPGSLLAALFLHERTGDERWAELFRAIAMKLWSQLEWSDEYGCHYWTQVLYGRACNYLDGTHGFVATALPLSRGRALLGAESWAAWQACIANTVTRTATWEGSRVNWRVWLHPPPTKPMLMQFCHGAPGFITCLGRWPGDELDTLLAGAGEAVWAAGPLGKGSNLCHGTGGNGYAFLTLFRRTGNPLWLQRARAFAMHGIAQSEADQRRHGHLRYSLWSGDLGLAIFLWDCLRAEAAFPTLDVFYGA